MWGWEAKALLLFPATGGGSGAREEGGEGCGRLRKWNKQSTEACLAGSAHGLFQSLEHRMF